MSRPRLLDLFCGAGGAAMGYHRAGFDVLGVDIDPQPNYPFRFEQGDALEFPVWGFEAIHASPPCQAYASLSKGDHPRLIEPTRAKLRASGLPYVIENISDARAHLIDPIQLCGLSFDLNVRRHRLFESSVFLMAPPCVHDGREIRAYYGKKGWLVWSPGGAAVQKRGHRPLLRGNVDQAPRDMGIDWMTWDELREAIPPDYTEWIGKQLMAHLSAVAA